MIKGLILRGTIVASNIQTGNRKDDGKPYARRNTMITDEERVHTYSESVDPSTKVEPHPVGKDATVIVTYANTNAGMIQVGGELTLAK
jgi:hypothetical protein